jgi:anti-sigma factor RsiW
MNCAELKSWIYGYVELQLSAEQRAEFERHVAACEPCGALMADVQRLSCRDFVQFLNDYFEGELPGEQRAVFDRHMELCPPCKDYLDSYRQTIELGRLACADASKQVPDEVPDSLVRAILKARREQA